MWVDPNAEHIIAGNTRVNPKMCSLPSLELTRMCSPSLQEPTWVSSSATASATGTDPIIVICIFILYVLLLILHIFIDVSLLILY